MKKREVNEWKVGLVIVGALLAVLWTLFAQALFKYLETSTKYSSDPTFWMIIALFCLVGAIWFTKKVWNDFVK